MAETLYQDRYNFPICFRRERERLAQGPAEVGSDHVPRALRLLADGPGSALSRQGSS